MSSRSRGFILTIPLYDVNKERIKLHYIIESLQDYDFFVFQIESGDITGYKHIQLYVEHDDKISFSTLKKFFPRAHIESRLGTKKQAYIYCTKTETRLHGPFEFGIKPSFKTSSEIKRTATEEFVSAIRGGATDKELLECFPSLYLQRKKMINDIREIYNIKFERFNRDVKVYYLSGSTGVGKSSYIRRKFKSSDIYVVSDYDGHPFDNYKGEKVIVFDEYRSNFSLSLFLQYLDIYPLDLPARYENKVAKYDYVYIVSNWPIEKQYEGLPDYDIRAFYRRIRYKIDITTDYIVRYRLIKGTTSFTDKEWVFNPLGEQYKKALKDWPIDPDIDFDED